MVIGKFRVSKNQKGLPGDIASAVRLDALYDPNLDEDKRFAENTPTGHIEMVITNPKAIDQFKPLKTPIYCVFMGAVEYEDFQNLMKNG